MLTSGDVVDLDLGMPHGREAGFRLVKSIAQSLENLRTVAEA